MQAYNMTQRVIQEVEIHARLKHSSILELFTFFEDRNYVYLVLELAHNGALHKYLSDKQQPLTEYEAASITSQVCNGLLYLHKNNIMHRDISMSNLLLTVSMQVKISDFGLATQLDKYFENKHTTLCGTPNYISPEVASRSSHGLKTDNWSLGCLLYTLLVGRPPFDMNGVKSTLTQVVIGNYTIPNHISAEAQDLIKRLLCKDQSKRIELHQVVTHPFMMKFNHKSISSMMMDSGIASSIGTKHSSSSISNNNNMSTRSRSMEVLKKPVEQQNHQQIIGSASMYRCMSSASINKQSIQMQSQHSIQMEVTKRLDVPPLNTIRLQPTRYKMKNVVLSIMSEPPGEVVLEFVKYKPKYEEERVYDVCRISSDGLHIIMFQPNRGKGLRLQQQPPEIPQDGADHMYGYGNLPEKHFKKYLYAHRFVQMVRAKTPKVTFYSELGKSQLMESLDDFEMVMYDGSGSVTKRKDSQFEAQLATATHCVIQHAEKCFQHCVKIEQILSLTSLDHPCFPVIIGRRPAEREQQQQPKEVLQEQNFFNNYISSSQTPLRTPKITMPSFSLEHHTPTSNYRYPDSPLATPPSSHQFHQQKTVIPGVGNVALLLDGSVEINYNDGTNIVVVTKEQGGGIVFSSSTIDHIKYSENDLMPEIVRSKVNQLPTVLSHLKHRDAEFITSTPVQQQSYNPVFHSNRLNHMKFIR